MLECLTQFLIRRSPYTQLPREQWSTNSPFEFYDPNIFSFIGNLYCSNVDELTSEHFLIFTFLQRSPSGAALLRWNLFENLGNLPRSSTSKNLLKFETFSFRICKNVMIFYKPVFLSFSGKYEKGGENTSTLFPSNLLNSSSIPIPLVLWVNSVLSNFTWAFGVKKKICFPGVTTLIPNKTFWNLLQKWIKQFLAHSRQGDNIFNQSEAVNIFLANQRLLTCRHVIQTHN